MSARTVLISGNEKRVRAGHRASATRIQGQITTALGATPPNVERLSMLKLTLEAEAEDTEGA